ncbi:short chain dehydrogenase [Venturia nashicola]|nr:short chain dehydrogenase [Venturia nashicola]
MFVFEFLKGQFKTLPHPDGDFTGQTVIVTGSNCGLGLEAARHFVRLRANLVILACRNESKGALAKASIEKSTERMGVVKVWPLDLASFNSVKSFCKRIENLDRIDVLIANAGIATPKCELIEGFESTMTVNVLSTFLMIISVIPKMNELAEKLGTKSRVVVVTSDAHHMAKFPERLAPNVFDAFKDPLSKNQDDRYPTSKLLEILIVRELAAASPAIVINSVNPGYCKSELQRYATPLRYLLVKLGGFFVARSTEVGSRTLLAGAASGEETNGKYMSNCVIAKPVAWIDTEHGLQVGKKAWVDLLQVLESIQQDVTSRFENRDSLK